jgi:hypothetical protein
MSLPNVIDSGKPLSIVVLSGILLPLVIACGITADSRRLIMAMPPRDISFTTTAIQHPCSKSPGRITAM